MVIPAVFVAVSIGITVFESVVTKAVAPLGVMAMSPGWLPTPIGVPTELVAVWIGVTFRALIGHVQGGPVGCNGNGRWHVANSDRGSNGVGGRVDRGHAVL